MFPEGVVILFTSPAIPPRLEDAVYPATFITLEATFPTRPIVDEIVPVAAFNAVVRTPVFLT